MFDLNYVSDECKPLSNKFTSLALHLSRVEVVNNLIGHESSCCAF